MNGIPGADWDPRQAGDRVLAGLVNICQPQVKGAHDSDFVIVGGKAYIVYMANDCQPSEDARWPFIYSALTIVDLATGTPERTEIFAAGERVYDNATLAPGACFVPRITRRDDHTLRCFFASEQPGERQSQTWFIDYDLARGAFAGSIHRAEIETSLGVFPMQPACFHEHAAARGFAGPAMTYGLYMIDSFKHFGGRVYAVLNGFPGGPLALSVLSDAMDRFTIIGDFFGGEGVVLTESSINRLPDGRWCAVSRQEFGDLNYMWCESEDGAEWTEHAPRAVTTPGTRGKPTLDRFGDVYYLGWQEATTINGVHRSVFNIEVSRDGREWLRKYRFETEKSFQYPVLRECEGTIYLTVTQGDDSADRKERIMFGRLEG